MNNIPTAEDFMNSEQYEPDHGICFEDYHGNDVSMVPDMLIEFAKLHVEAALKAASNNVRTKNAVTYPEGSYMNIVESIDKNSILNAYPLTNIK